MDNLSETEQRDLLRVTFEGQAEWRRQKAIEYADDKRNAEAAAIFDRLAATVSGIPADVLSAYYALFDDAEDTEIESEMMRQVGFYTEPATAEDFVRNFIADRTS